MNLLNITKLAWSIEYNRNVKKADPAMIGKVLAKRLPEMGPSFIKIGQFISTREDIFGKSLTTELKLLQDSTPPIDSKWVKEATSYLALHDFQDIPIATASIGQVHRGILKNGKTVAIKVRRPRITQDIKNDFEFVLGVLELLKKVTDNRKILELDIVFRQYYMILMEEIDFSKEVSNIAKFQKYFEDYPWIKVPEVYPEYCTNDVIVMEFVPAKKIDSLPDKLSKQKCKLAVDKIVRCYMNQIMKYNFVHIDPHPGNLGVTKDGKLVFYDYGMMIDLTKEKLAERFDEFLLCVFERNAEGLANFLVSTGVFEVLPGNMPFFTSFVKLFLMYTDTLNIEEFKNSTIRQLDDLGGMPFFISSRFVMLFRGLGILEGIIRKLDPDFNYQETLRPYVEDKMNSVDYVRNRAMTDIQSFQQLPSSLSMQQLQLEILSKKFEQKKTTDRVQFNAYAVAGVMVALFILYK